jgi:hypothetical protein
VTTSENCRHPLRCFTRKHQSGRPILFKPPQPMVEVAHPHQIRIILHRLHRVDQRLPEEREVPTAEHGPHGRWSGAISQNFPLHVSSSSDLGELVHRVARVLCAVPARRLRGPRCAACRKAGDVRQLSQAEGAIRIHGRVNVRPATVGLRPWSG